MIDNALKMGAEPNVGEDMRSLPFLPSVWPCIFMMGVVAVRAPVIVRVQTHLSR